MKKYMVTYVEGDTYNIPSYYLIECEEENLVKKLDELFSHDAWIHNSYVKIYEVLQNISKWDLMV